MYSRVDDKRAEILTVNERAVSGLVCETCLVLSSRRVLSSRLSPSWSEPWSPSVDGVLLSSWCVCSLLQVLLFPDEWRMTNDEWRVSSDELSSDKCRVTSDDVSIVIGVCVITNVGFSAKSRDGLHFRCLVGVCWLFIAQSQCFVFPEFLGLA